jgi:hypothetical protein
MKLNMDLIFGDIDKKLAILAIFMAILLSILLTRLSTNSVFYLPIPLSIFVMSIFYLIFRKKLLKFDFQSFENTKISWDKSNILIFNLIFVVLFTVTVMLLLNQLYYRPFIYFVLITVLIGFSVFEIIFLSTKNNYSYVTLFKIILISLNLRVGIQLIFPNSFILFDPWYHKAIIDGIVSGGFIPNILPYNSLPGFHIVYASEIISSGINSDFIVNSLNTGLKSSLIILIIYLIGKNLLKSEKIGLLSSLMYVVLDRAIIYDSSFIPTSLTVVFAILVIYLLLRQDYEKTKKSYILLVIIFMSALIISHTLTAIFLVILIVFFYIISQLYFRLHRIGSIPVLGILLLFVISTFAYWTYVSGYFITQLSEIIRFGFVTDAISPTVSASTNINYMATIPFIEHFTNYLGFYIFIALGIFGVLFSFSPKNFSLSRKTSSLSLKVRKLFSTSDNPFVFSRENRNFTFLAIAGMVLLFLSFSGIITNFYSIPDRWWYYSEHILPIIAVIGLISLSYSVTKNKKISAILLMVLFVSVSFFSITDSIANMDSPLFYSKNIAIRSALTTSEMASLNTLNPVTGGINNSQKISSDPLYILPYSSIPGYTTKYQVIDAIVYQNNSYEELGGIVVFRKYVLDGNPFQAGGAYKLESNPLKFMNKDKYNRIYDSKSVLAYDSMI